MISSSFANFSFFLFTVKNARRMYIQFIHSRTAEYCLVKLSLILFLTSNSIKIAQYPFGFSSKYKYIGLWQPFVQPAAIKTTDHMLLQNVLFRPSSVYVYVKNSILHIYLYNIIIPKLFFEKRFIRLNSKHYVKKMNKYLPTFYYVKLKNFYNSKKF